MNKHRKSVIVRNRGQETIQLRVGMENMKNEELTENIQVVIRALEGKLKRGMKNISYAYIKTTMGPPVKVKS
jgi:large subunit ribosomal protein L1